MGTFSRDACAALLVLAGCAGGGAQARQDLDDVKAELRSLRRDNEELARKVDALQGRVDVMTARLTRGPEASRAEPLPAAAPPAAALVPPDLAVVRVTPHVARAAPPVPVAVPISEPDPRKLEQLARPSRRELSADAEAELRAARRKDGVDRAHALEDFASRYPRHASADNALVEAAEAYAAAGLPDAACAVGRRVVDGYPAGDAMSDALERLAWCESRRGAAEAERRLLERLVTEYPRTPAAQRAAVRLATIPGSAGDTPSAAVPARSSP